jgi:hypothetical protein
LRSIKIGTLITVATSGLAHPCTSAARAGVRCFGQYYQSFCGFESIETARLFLGVFEKLYRLTPFSDDAQPRIRGKCPLELAGYDIHQLPMAALWNDLSVEWPVEVLRNDVPNQ